MELYQEIGDAGKVCRRCGISRSILRKWLKRYEEKGLDGLEDYSRKPINSPSRKIFSEQELIILSLRQERKLGVRRIQSELKRHHELSLSLATIHKILKKHQLPYLQKKRNYRKQAKRYNCKLPGQRVQMDVCKIANRLYQYTAIDDCTRYKVIALYKRRTAKNTLDFIENQVFYRLPFPIQRIQTDRGQEFMAYEVQEKLLEWGIKFRPVRPASPHLNGKVERSQRTDLDEFYSAVDIKDPNLEELLSDWEFYYNWHRPHSSLNGKTPQEKHIELLDKTPLWDDIDKIFDPKKETIIPHNYQTASSPKMLKPSL
ncbi:MAG: IS481 family transposase [Alphaproteobacteria bacterium]|nr:IS481 family transposase [Alphaproteobacteria bacterium]